MTLVWGHDQLSVELTTTPTSPMKFVRLGLPGDPPLLSEQPAIEISIASAGRSWGRSLSRTVVGAQLRYVDHVADVIDGWSRLRVVTEDAEFGVVATLNLLTYPNESAMVGWVKVEVREGFREVTVLSASSLAFGLVHADETIEELKLTAGENSWLSEGRWKTVPLRDAGLPQVGIAEHRVAASHATITRAGYGPWSTSASLPVAVIESSKRARMWQIENNGPWRWDIGEDSAGAFAVLAGPTDENHSAYYRLAPGDEFETVRASISFGNSFFEASAAMTSYRRRVRAQHGVLRTPKVVYNDYLNTLMADPSEEKLLPLIASAAEAGAEVFCIDAGWYSDGDGWWDTVGAWKPSLVRFPRGLEAITRYIEELGMVPGIWMEPGVLGVRSEVIRALGIDAVLCRNGEPVVEHGRYCLNYSNPKVSDYLDATIDALIADLNIGYFKFDDNVDPSNGGSPGSASLGAALQESANAQAAWLDRLRLRHPTLILENCASGGMREDFVLIQRTDLQSTSDQQIAALYPPIACAAPMMMPPEAAGNWAVPTKEDSPQELTFSLCTSMLGNFFFSGFLDQLHAPAFAAVQSAVKAYKGVRDQLARAKPFWPLGLAGWSDDVIVLGLRDGGDHFVTVWNRSERPTSLVLDIDVSGSLHSIEPIFPTSLHPWQLNILPTGRSVGVSIPAGLDARTFVVHGEMA
ncbi:glycoside hydrolase family 36 protein [Leifsonia sp. AG29]|uniref:glycoside hydrolase family 36 protein n=1 Tax=Leifsonia sp. AG29 TaxID=2598860 RepID=UPI00131E0FF5|nr:glycoside hydrolase family 36 protein [Leifsonia sp. AG29]